MKQRFLSFGVPENYCNQIINNIDYARFIDQIQYHDIFQSVKIFFSEIIPLEKKLNHAKKWLKTMDYLLMSILWVISTIMKFYVK